MKLSTHFTLEELTFSETAARHNLDNVPSQKVIENLKRVATVLEQIRAVVNRPIMVSSGYRSPAVNRAVGGSMSSAHMQGLSADIRAAGMTPRELAEAIKHNAVKFDQLILEFDRWVHVGLAVDEPRNQVLTIRFGTGYMQGLV
ncbi:MAG: peptidase M15 [Burkholderiales bacterium RIFCSPLOWO2_02_FULL_57_36]|nr:MAG: peptidase M15 [Burkholderiales bacterium RIFCSPLOWO2_02_FULL_57_36]